MRARTGWLCLAILLACAIVPGLRADVLQVGTADTLAYKPFGDDLTTAYQQLYSTGAFSSLAGPVSISELDFFVDLSSVNFADPTLQTYPAQYQVTLTELDPGTGALGASIVSDLSPSSAPTANSTGTLNLTSGTLALTLNSAFVFDPTKDLLLDVQQVGAAGTNPWGLFNLQADDTLSSALIDAVSCQAGCVYDGTGVDPDTGDLLPQFGLVTAFVEAPAGSPSTLPEPSAVTLLGTGLTLLVIVARRRKISRAATRQQA